MRCHRRDSFRQLTPIVLCAAIVWSATLSAAEIRLKDGRTLQGMYGEVASLTDQPAPPSAEGGSVPLIGFVDNNLCRIFFPKRHVVAVNQAETARPEKFMLRQPIGTSSQVVKAVGPSLRVTPFDQYGRRIFTFQTAKGPLDVVQCITELTPDWAKVEGKGYMWDMRIATSSIPRDVLHKILLNQIDPSNLDHHKKIARFYLQGERFEEATAQLQQILKQFQDQPNLQADLEPTIRQLRQLSAQRLLTEMKLRRQAGQHKLVSGKLASFPTEGIAGEILQEARELLEEYQTLESRRQETLKWLDAEIDKVPEQAFRERIKPVRDEIAAELNVDTMPRMAAFRQNAVGNMLPGEKVSLAISGWLLSADNAIIKLPVALSAYKVRGLIRQYMAEPVKIEREKIFQYFQSEEAAAASTVTAILANMKPPLDPPEPVDAEKRPGYYKLEVQVMPKEPAITYYVQLPPEYNPYRRYPTVLTLHGAATTAEQQVDWWAGVWTESGWRAGQAGRQGYIVVAPAWTNEHQKEYQYSAREHAAALNALRDACRRFAIDTDRVFLSGHSMGGDAAWDIGLAHPDLWAGVLPVVAESEKFVAKYGDNAKKLPLYFIFGEYDNNKLKRSARDLDRYFKQLGVNVTVVEYLGRGHEHFYEDVLRMFDWMGRFRRDFFPREFEAATLRIWDNYFWWIEMSGLPPGSMIEPAHWPTRNVPLPVTLSGRITDGNGLVVKTGSSQVSIWISPRMLDFEKRANIQVNGRSLNTANRFIQPDLRTILEDVRTRGDRQNPFWLKLDMTTGRSAG